MDVKDPPQCDGDGLGINFTLLWIFRKSSGWFEGLFPGKTPEEIIPRIEPNESRQSDR